MFEKASRMKLRFAYKGQATVEDLWDLKVEALDDLYKTLRVQQKETSGESLLSPPSKNDGLDLQIDIVKHIVSVKLQEKQIQLDKAKRRHHRSRLAELVAEKEEETLKSKSIDELRQLLTEMETTE